MYSYCTQPGLKWSVPKWNCYRRLTGLNKRPGPLISLNDNLKSYFQEMQYQDEQPPNYTTNGADEYGEKVYDNRRYKD